MYKATGEEKKYGDGENKNTEEGEYKEK
jgi:hypothetical protein